MFGTIDYFSNYFRSCIMNNLVISNPQSLYTIYSLLTDEISKRHEDFEEKEKYLRNLESAFNELKIDLCEWEEEEREC